MSLCKYKNVFGKEGEGVHSIRLFNVAVVDVLMTLLVCWIISIYFNLQFFWVALCGFIIGILAHRLFCVNTTINKMIFGVVGTNGK